MLFGVFTKAQNLVPNPSFEEYLICPTIDTQFTDYISAWVTPTEASPDFFNVCSLGAMGVPDNNFGFQIPKTGNGYAGLYLYVDSLHEAMVNYREYIQVELSQELQTDSAYCVAFYVSLAARYQMTATSNVGLYFSDTQVVNADNDTLNYSPQIFNIATNVLLDTATWTVISGQFVAAGGEKFITIGNFLPNSLTTVANDTQSFNLAYYFIDDVSVMKCSQVGTSVQSVAQQVNVQLNPNPVSNALQITINGLVGNAKIEIVNTLGQIVFSRDIITSNTFHQATSTSSVQAVDMSHLPIGFYAVNVTSNNTRVSRKLLKQ